MHGEPADLVHRAPKTPESQKSAKITKKKKKNTHTSWAPNMRKKKKKKRKWLKNGQFRFGGIFFIFSGPNPRVGDLIFGIFSVFLGFRFWGSVPGPQPCKSMTCNKHLFRCWRRRWWHCCCYSNGCITIWALLGGVLSLRKLNMRTAGIESLEEVSVYSVWDLNAQSMSGREQLRHNQYLQDDFVLFSLSLSIYLLSLSISILCLFFLFFSLSLSLSLSLLFFFSPSLYSATWLVLNRGALCQRESENFSHV